MKNWQGEFGEAYELGAEGLRIALEHDLVIPLLRHVWLQAVALTGRGGYEACRLLEEGLALAEKVGDDAFIPRYLNTLGWLHIECADLDRGLELSRLGVEWARRRRHATGVEQTAFTEINRGDAFMVRGDLTSAREVLGEAHHLVKDASIYARLST